MKGEWKDCIGWKREGLQLSTTSNEAARLFDAALTQYAGFYNDANLGGFSATLDRMQESDSDFIMGQVIINGVTVLSSLKTPRTNPAFREDLDRLNSSLKDARRRGLLTEREELHAEAVLLVGDGQNKKACDVWQNILMQYPTDILALKFFQDRCFYLGNSRKRVRDIFERIKPFWSPRKQPLYPQFLSMYSFSLFEVEEYSASEKLALESLVYDRRQAWPIHSIAHCMEMTDRPDDGLSFIEKSASDWSNTSTVNCHMWWHAALYYVEKSDYKSALELYDEEIEKVAGSQGSLFNIDDAASLLYRLQLDGIDVGNRWNLLHDVGRPYLDDHMLPFHDIHLCMTYLYGKSTQNGTSNSRKFASTADQFIESMTNYTNSSNPYTDHRYNGVGLAVCEALRAFEQQDYSHVVDLILPHEWDLPHLGGSDAQLDVIYQILIHAALRSNNKTHRSAGRRLLIERRARRPNSSLIDRLLGQALLTSDDLAFQF